MVGAPMTAPDAGHRPPTVLVKVCAELVVEVPALHPHEQATDALNDTFRAAPALFADWSFARDGRTLDITVLDPDPDDYEEGDAWPHPTPSHALTLRHALAHVDAHGFGDDVDADAVIRQAGTGLLTLYDVHGLETEAASSAADQCGDLYALLDALGLPVA